MYEEAISQLETMGLSYQETDDGTLIIDIESADKTDVVNIVAFLNDQGIDYTIDAMSITVTMMEPTVDEDMEEDIPTDAIDAAMGDMF